MLLPRMHETLVLFGRLWMSARIQWLSGLLIGTGIASTLSSGLSLPLPCHAKRSDLQLSLLLWLHGGS